MLQSVAKKRDGELPATFMKTLLFMLGQDSSANERLGKWHVEEPAYEMPVLERAS